MQNSTLQFRQSSIISKKPSYLNKKLKNFDELQLPYSLIIFAEIWSSFPLNNVYKRVFRILFMLFRSWVIDKNGICECVEASSFLYEQITQILDIDE